MSYLLVKSDVSTTSPSKVAGAGTETLFGVTKNLIRLLV